MLVEPRIYPEVSRKEKLTPDTLHLGAEQRFERSELDLYTFYRQFGEELSNVEANNQNYIKFCKSRGQGEHLPTEEYYTGAERLLMACLLCDDSTEVPELPKKLHVDGRDVSLISLCSDLACPRLYTKSFIITVSTAVRTNDANLDHDRSKDAQSNRSIER